jgi:pyruvate/2-oxoglutarate dehydrogenase complex dihydrolipoamide acyltransferase (E2) component
MLLAAVLWVSGCTVEVGPVAAVADPHARLRPDVAHGYARYHRQLARYGHWGPDPDYGVHWCPRRDLLDPSTVFRPYVSRGHWAISDAPIGHAPAGSPAWISEDADTWGVTTMRHGWWIRVEDDDAPQQWCWVPGVEETPGRVVWRSGDGFVGWAPEEPDSCSDDDDDCDDAFDWAYTLIGKLVDDLTSDNVLPDSAAETARKATAASAPRGRDKQRTRVGPTAKIVSDARLALADYAEKNQLSLSQASLRLTAEKVRVSAREQAALGGGVAGTGSAGSAAKGGTQKAKEASAKEASAKEASPAVAPLPPPLPPQQIPAAAYYEAMAAGPAQGEGGNLPRVPRGASTTGGITGEPARGSSSGGSYGGGSSGGGSYGGGGSSHAHRSGRSHTRSSSHGRR